MQMELVYSVGDISGCAVGLCPPAIPQSRREVVAGVLLLLVSPVPVYLVL